MSYFANAMEDADTEQTDAPVEAPPEDESATAGVTETEAAATDVAQESADADAIGDEQEQLEEVGEAVEQESAGLSPEAARYLNLSLKRIVGASHANKIVATENYSSGRAAQEEAKRIALEGIKDTLKAFWQAIKTQLKKFYAKVKTFFVKMFSGAKKLADRAKKIQQKANDTVGTIEDKSFSFGQTKAIAVDGKYSEAGSLTSGLNEVRKWIEKNITVQKAEKYESVIDKAQSQIESAIKAVAKKGNIDAAKVDKITTQLDQAGLIDIAPLGAGKIEPKLAEMFGGGKNGADTIAISKSLPGGKAIVSIKASETAASAQGAEIEAIIKSVKNSRLVLSNDKYNPREVSEGDVKTLTTSQIDKVCDDVIEIAESAYTYEKAWERRDNFQAKLEREIESVIKEVDSNDDTDSRAQRITRSFAESFTASVRRRTTFESQFISYALTTGNAFLNYAERSLAQHKSK